MIIKRLIFALFILFLAVFMSCSKQKVNEIGDNVDFQFVEADKIVRHKLYFDESRSEIFDFDDDRFECIIEKGKAKNNLKSFCYCAKSFSKKFDISVNLDMFAEELIVVRISQGLYGFAFLSSEGNNFFVYNTRKKIAEKLYFDISSGMEVKIIDFKNGIIIGDIQKERYLFSTVRKVLYKIENPHENDFSKWTIPPCEEIVRNQNVTLLKTHVLKDKVWAKNYPKVNAEDSCELEFGKPIYVLGNYYNDSELWICCTESSHVEKTPLGYDGVFWLRQGNIELPENFEQSTITFSKITKQYDWNDSPRYNSSFCKIEIAVKRGENISLKNVTASKLDNQGICFFNWNDYEDGFSYCDSVGTYAWDTVTNEIYPISCIGNLEGCFENLVTSDNKYLFAIKKFTRADFFDTVEIMDISTGESKGRWDFYKSLEYDDKSIVVGDEYYPQMKNIKGTASGDSLGFAQEFESSYTKSDEETSWGSNGTVYVKYRLNLDDFSTEFIGCEYVKGYAF